MSVTMYGFWRSLAAFRVRAALNYKEIPFNEKIISICYSYNDTPLLQNIKSS